MSSADDCPQIGNADVDRDALAEKGVGLAELMAELSATLNAESASDAPADGWRVLSVHSSGSRLLGTPVDDAGSMWRVASVGPQTGIPVLVHPDPQPLRPSRSERRDGLELRWPLMMVNGTTDNFVIDIVNGGHTRWIPNGDSFRVFGAFADLGKDTYIGWSSPGAEAAVPLDPGESTRVPVTISHGHDLTPGEYSLHATLVDLNVRTPDPLTVQLSAQAIAALRPRESRPSVAQQRRSLDRQIDGMRAQLAAKTSLVPLAEAIAGTSTEREAVARIRTLCDYDEATALQIYNSPMSQLHAPNSAALEHLIGELVRRRDAL